MYNIIKDFNETNSTKDKLAKLKKYKDNTLYTRVLELTYDKARFTFGITMKNVSQSRAVKLPPYLPLECALEGLDLFITRKSTGNNALYQLGQLLDKLSYEDAEVLKLIIGRDLKIGVGRTLINKVHKGLIIKPLYKRCGVFNKKTSGKIVFPAIIQQKADGTYRETLVKDGNIYYSSRSGESYNYPLLSEEIKNSALKDGYYFGELTVEGISNRAIGNGMINSDNCPHDSLIYSLWEYCTEEEYQKAKMKVKGALPKVKYKDTLKLLSVMLEASELRYIGLIETHAVDDVAEAMQLCSAWMKEGREGAVLKNKGMVMKDGTSTDQLKMKLEICVECRMTGYKKGTKGTKREGKIGSIQFANDEGTVRGYASGFNDKMLDEISDNPDMYSGKVFTLTCNDITKGENNNHYALSHPRFDEWRDDKDSTDTLERMFELKECAMCLS